MLRFGHTHTAPGTFSLLSQPPPSPSPRMQCVVKHVCVRVVFVLCPPSPSRHFAFCPLIIELATTTDVYGANTELSCGALYFSCALGGVCCGVCFLC